MSVAIRWSISGPEFESFLNRYRNQLAIFHFWADWNPLDPGMFEVFDEIHEAIGIDVALGRVQVGPPENRDLCQWLGIVQVPTVLYVFRNRVIDVRVGFSKNRLVNHVQMLLHNCRAAGTEQPLGMMDYPSEETGYPGPGLASPGFGPAGSRPPQPGAWGSGPVDWSAGAGPNSMPYAPQRRFGLEVAQPMAPAAAAERQSKSWLSRWLSFE
jgi:hypothetical protein